MSIDCREDNKQQIFCDPEILQCASKDPCEPIKSTEEYKFECNYRGKFVHPLDCSKFIYCEDFNTTAKEYSCPKETKFDSGTQTCKSTTFVCVNYSAKENGVCANRPNETLAHPDKSIYVICPENDNVPLQVHTCQLPLMKYDRKLSECTFSCPKEGFYRHLSDEKYYACWRNETKLVAQEQYCQKGAKFDVESNFCKTIPPSTSSDLPPSEL